jgi:hypothetical protein
MGMERRPTLKTLKKLAKTAEPVGEPEPEEVHTRARAILSSIGILGDLSAASVRVRLARSGRPYSYVEEDDWALVGLDLSQAMKSELTRAADQTSAGHEALREATYDYLAKAAPSQGTSSGQRALEQARMVITPQAP